LQGTSAVAFAGPASSSGTQSLAATTTGLVTATLSATQASQTLASGSTSNFAIVNGAATATITATGTTGTLSITGQGSTTEAVAAGTGNVSIVGAAGTDVYTVTGLATSGQTFTGTVAKFNVTGGAGAQTITTGAAADIVIGGAGADIINLGSSDTAADIVKLAFTAESTTAAYDTVANFVIANDKIDLATTYNGSTGTTAITFTVKADVTAATGVTNGIVTGKFTFNKAAATSLTDAIAKVGADVATAGNAVFFNYGGNDYFFADTDGATTTTADVLIQLTGVAGATMAATSEVFTIS
jgi:hypothetical protein